MKKLFIMLMLSVFILTGCFNNLKTYNEITLSKLNQMIEDKESFILYIGSASCSHCQAYTLTINRVIKNYQVVINYIDIDKLTSEEKNELKNQIYYSGTPTTIFIEDGKEKSIYNRINGAISYDKVIEKLRENKYIK